MPPSSTPPPAAAPPRPRDARLAAALRRPAGRRLVSGLVAVMALAGIGVLGYPLATDLYGQRLQGQLQTQYAQPAAVAAYAERRVPVGDGLTMMRIPRLGVEVLVVEGTTTEALRAGAGHYVGSPLPGEDGNLAIAGHRTTYDRPLHRMDELRPGDVVELETPFAVHTYRAVPEVDGHANPWVVAPSDVSVLASEPGRSTLTLTTCHPKGSARQRLVMRFELVSSVPLPAPA
jgi:sortase A